ELDHLRPGLAPTDLDHHRLSDPKCCGFHHRERDRVPEEERMRTAGDGADAASPGAHHGPMAADVAWRGGQTDQRPLRARLLDSGQGLAPDEIALAQLHRPAEPR